MKTLRERATEYLRSWKALKESMYPGAHHAFCKAEWDAAFNEYTRDGESWSDRAERDLRDLDAERLAAQRAVIAALFWRAGEAIAEAERVAAIIVAMSPEDVVLLGCEMLRCINEKRAERLILWQQADDMLRAMESGRAVTFEVVPHA